MYLTDSIDLDTYWTYNFMMNDIYKLNKQEIFNKELAVIINGLYFECMDTTYTKNEAVIFYLYKVYSSPSFKSEPELAKHLLYYLDICNTFEQVPPELLDYQFD